MNGGMDLSQFFSPNAWGSWNPPPQSMFPMANTNGAAPTPSGLLGNAWGMPPPNPAPNALNMPRPPAMGGVGMPPSPPAMMGGAPTSGDADPMSGGGTAGVPGAGASPGVGAILNNALGKATGSAGFPGAMANFAKQMMGNNQLKAPAPAPISMAQPIGPGNMQGMGGGIAGLLSPLLQRMGGGAGGGLGFGA